MHTHVFQVQLDETDSYKERPPIKIVIVGAEGTLPVSLSAAVHANNDKDQYSNHEKRDSHTQTHNEFIGFCKRQDILWLMNNTVTIGLFIGRGINILLKIKYFDFLIFRLLKDSVKHRNTRKLHVRQGKMGKNLIFHIWKCYTSEYVPSLWSFLQWKRKKLMDARIS